MIAYCSTCKDEAILLERESGTYCTWCGTRTTPHGPVRGARGVIDKTGRPEAAYKLRLQGKTWREVCATVGYNSASTAITAVHRFRARMDEAA